ncbi:allatostatin-A receptor-like [Oculina patagonica]
MHGLKPSSIFSTNNSSTAANGTRLTSKVFLFTPLQSSNRIALFSLLVLVGIVGFVGNTLVLCFLKSKKRDVYSKNTSAFGKNFYIYIRSLAVSDVLCDVISLPPVCCQLYLDVFNSGWSCFIVRYFNIVFPSVTMNNLLFISIARYVSTRKVPSAFSHNTVKNIVIFAWLGGAFVALFPTATYSGVRFDLNDTHYTVVCKYGNQYLPFRILFVGYIIIQYFLPGCIIIRINVSLIITLWTRLGRRRVDVQQDNALKMMYRAATIRGTSIIVTLTFAFVLPYVFYFAHVIYNMATQITFDFESDFVIRAVSALLVYSNSVINVIIYMVQIKGFRTFLKKALCLYSHQQFANLFDNCCFLVHTHQLKFANFSLSCEGRLRRP